MFQKVINSILFVFFIGLSSFGQNLDKDVQEIIQNLDSASSVSIKVKVDVYSRKGGAKTFSTTASMQRQKNSFLNILAKQENFENAKYQVSIDHEEKKVLILKKEATAKARAIKEDFENELKKLQKMLEKQDKGENVKDSKVVKLVSNVSGVRKYSITNIAEYKEISIVLDLNAKVIKSITYEYSEKSEMKGQYVVLDYSEFKIGGDLSKLLTPSNYFTEANGKYTLVSSLKNYKIYTEL